jgi:hypothetical protein
MAFNNKVHAYLVRYNEKYFCQLLLKRDGAGNSLVVLQVPHIFLNTRVMESQ